MSAPRDSTARNGAVYYRRSRFTTHLPINRRYSPAHYWLLEETPGIWRVGLTRFAIRMLGDIVEFDFSLKLHDPLSTGDEIGSIEGLKAVTSVFAAGDGRFAGEGAPLRANVTLADTDPYGDGWLYRLAGTPAPDTVDVHGYVTMLDATIDTMLTQRHEPADDGQESA